MVEYKGQYTISDSRLILGDDGRWTSTVKYTQGRSVDGETWEDKSTTSTAYNTDPSIAIAEATFTLLEYLKSYNYTLFESDADVEDNG